MGRTENRERARLEQKIAADLAKRPTEFEELSPSEVSRILSNLDRRTPPPKRVFKNHLYSVQIFPRETDWGNFEKAMIRRHDSKPIHDWNAIQEIKNEIWGPESTALEVFPKESNKVDVANLYWIWVMADGRDCPIESRRDRIL